MASQRKLGLLFVLVGPPGVGKNALMNTVLNRLNDLHQLPTATTRPRRPSEQQGREHIFVSRDEFQQMIDKNALIEWQVVHGEWYGMPKVTVETAINQQQDLIADIDVLGATELRSIYPDNAVLIFIQPPTVEVLKRRMQTRGETEMEIEKRLQRVNMELQYAPLCDYLITNDNIDQAGETLYSIVLAERSHRTLLNLRVNNNLPRHKFTYAASVIPIYEDEVLYKSSEPHSLTTRLTYGEFPHEAACRVLKEQVKIDVNINLLYPNDNEYEQLVDDLFIAPAGIEALPQAHFHQVTFLFIYRLPDRLHLSPEWEYVHYKQANIPSQIKPAILQMLSNNYPNEEIESYHEPA